MKELLKRVLPMTLTFALGAFLIAALDHSDPSLQFDLPAATVSLPVLPPVKEEIGGGGPSVPRLNVNDIFHVVELDRRAVITARPSPSYTEEARLNGTRGHIRLRAVLRASGEVTNISVLKGLPDGLTERAVEAARQIHFIPAQKDGRAVSQWIIIEYRFNIY